MSWITLRTPWGERQLSAYNFKTTVEGSSYGGSFAFDLYNPNDATFLQEFVDNPHFERMEVRKEGGQGVHEGFSDVLWGSIKIRQEIDRTIVKVEFTAEAYSIWNESQPAQPMNQSVDPDFEVRDADWEEEKPPSEPLEPGGRKVRP